MSKVLRDLLDAEEPQFSMLLRDLERASGERGTDTKLISDIAVSFRKSVKAIGLDPDDSTGREIYAAILNRVRDDDERIAKIIGGDNPSDMKQMTPLLVATAKESSLAKNVWVLKHSVAKQLLRKAPPKNLMKQLGYRSIDYMLRHEDVDEIYAALRFSENMEWLERHNGLFADVQPSDFEIRNAEMVIMDHDKYGDLLKKFVEEGSHNIVCVKELGVIAILPPYTEKSKGLTLRTLLLLYYYLNEIHLLSTFFKLKLVEKDFGRIVAESLVDDTAMAVKVAGHKVHWSVIQRYLSKLKPEDYQGALGPHVQPEDLAWCCAEDALCQLDEKMKFWRGLGYVGKMYDDAPITFNLIDAILNFANSLSYDERIGSHFRASLRDEIFVRYVGKQSLADQAMSSLQK